MNYGPLLVIAIFLIGYGLSLFGAYRVGFTEGRRHAAEEYITLAKRN
jgi:hypothetical protein